MFFFRLFLLICICSPALVWAGPGYQVDSIGTDLRIDEQKNQIQKLLAQKYFDFAYHDLKVVIDTNQKEPRGKIQGTKITLSAHIVKSSEFLKLFIHELGHYADIYFLNTGGSSRDPSAIFYAISWQEPTTKKPGESSKNFVSGYAATNQYEDFAESFVFYVFHNDTFAERALKNDALRQKYIFIQQYLFPSGAFTDTDFRLDAVPAYLWDTTKVGISVKKYLYYLNSSI